MKKRAIRFALGLSAVAPLVFAAREHSHAGKSAVRPAAEAKKD